MTELGDHPDVTRAELAGFEPHGPVEPIVAEFLVVAEVCPPNAEPTPVSRTFKLERYDGIAYEVDALDWARKRMAELLSGIPHKIVHTEKM